MRCRFVGLLSLLVALLTACVYGQSALSAGGPEIPQSGKRWRIIPMQAMIYSWICRRTMNTGLCPVLSGTLNCEKP